MDFYISYGLNIQSDIHLPEFLSVEECEPDLIIREGTTGRSRPKTNQMGSYFDLTADEAFIFWDRVGGFLVRAGKEIIVEPLPGVNQQIVRLPLLGPVLGLAIFQRGLIIFHASSVAIDGQAVAFLGASGQGKSTIAATLYARGHSLLADDLVVVDTNAGKEGPVMFPGYPQLKLFPEVARCLAGDPQKLPQLIAGTDKHVHLARERFSPLPAPLKGIYILEADDHQSIEPLRPPEGIVKLIGHSYGVWGSKRWMKRDVAASHLAQCAQVANRIPVFRLTRTGSLSGLSERASMVERHFRDTCCAVFSGVGEQLLNKGTSSLPSNLDRHQTPISFASRRYTISNATSKSKNWI